MRVIFNKKISYKPNLVILVYPIYPYNLMAYFCWFSYAIRFANIKPIFVVLGRPNFDVLCWARKLNFKILFFNQNTNIEEIINSINIFDYSIITFANCLCLRKFERNQEYFSKYFILMGKNKSNIQIGNIETFKSCDIYEISHDESRDICYKVINNYEIEKIDDNSNKIRLSKIIKQSLAFRPLIERSLP